MLNARLFTSALPIFLFVRDKPVLACQGNSFRGRGKSTSCTCVHTFFYAHPPRRQSRRLRRGWRVTVDITWGLRGAVACPVSRRGIARDISSSSPSSPHQEVGLNSHKWPSLRPASRYERFNTKSTPTAIPITSLYPPPVTRLCIFQPRNATFMQMEW